MFKNHFSGVVNALLVNLTNAMAERLNEKIQELKQWGEDIELSPTLEAPFYSLTVD
jgi:hypothetical protein